PRHESGVLRSHALSCCARRCSPGRHGLHRRTGVGIAAAVWLREPSVGLGGARVEAVATGIDRRNRVLPDNADDAAPIRDRGARWLGTGLCRGQRYRLRAGQERRAIAREGSLGCGAGLPGWSADSRTTAGWGRRGVFLELATRDVAPLRTGHGGARRGI